MTLKQWTEGTFDRWRTWHIETLIVAAFLGTITIAAPTLDRFVTSILSVYLGPGSNHVPSEWVGFFALLCAHSRNSILFRFTEAQKKERQCVRNDVASLTRDLSLDVMFKVQKALDSAQQRDMAHHVQCWRWATIMFYAAECFWAYYFLDHRAWVALAGVAVFVGYARWRAWYVKRRDYRNIVERGKDVIG